VNQGDDLPATRKLDPRLRRRARRAGYGPASTAAPSSAPRASARQPAAGAATSPDDRTPIGVKFTGDPADLRAVGLQIRSLLDNPVKRFKLATGTIPLARLHDLAAIDHVVHIEAGHRLRADLDKSVKEIGAHQVRTGPPGPLDGAGVVIGVIDSGFDFRHQVFRRPDETTRILALWDQGLDAEAGDSAPAGFDYGVEYSSTRIGLANQMADPFSIVRSKDTRGHGTHVAGIAAGDGSQAGNCRGADTFIGVAPAADLILVKEEVETERRGDSLNAVDAFNYIFNHQRVAGRPVVVNLSRGDNLGPHDGTSFLEEAIDTLLLQPRRAVVKSAGNEADEDKHAQGAVDPGDHLDLEFEVQPEDDETRFLELWYPGGDALSVTLIAPAPRGVTPPRSPTLGPGAGISPWIVNPGDPPDQQVEVEISHDLSLPNNGDNRIFLEFTPPDDGYLPEETWTLRLENAGGTAVQFHAWLEREEDRKDKPPIFTSHVSSDVTLSIPGTSESAIVVGAYATEGRRIGQLRRSSSRGPTRDGRHKPDIVAPGTAITSALAGVGLVWCCDCCNTFYVDKSGTSMAAPHVTGLVALMLQRNPSLTAAEIRQHLMQSARRPEEFTGPRQDDELNSWGFGRISAVDAINRVPAPAPGGGGSGAPIGGGGGPSPGPSIELSSDGRPRLPVASALDVTGLRHLVRAMPASPLYAALVSRHFSEVRGLINANRRVAVAWHRAGGPALVHRLLCAAASRPDPAARIDPVPVVPDLDSPVTRNARGGALGQAAPSDPAAPPDSAATTGPAALADPAGPWALRNGAAPGPERIARFLAVLARYASPALRDDVERQGEAFTALVLAGFAGLEDGPVAA
jgi:subtilisin family serine protease